MSADTHPPMQSIVRECNYFNFQLLSRQLGKMYNKTTSATNCGMEVQKEP